MDSADILEEVDRVSAKLIATEAVVVQILAPILEGFEPGLSGELIQMIRAGLNVPVLSDLQMLAAEEFLQSFADRIEARIRTKIGARR
jgi:hypothetical protein